MRIIRILSVISLLLINSLSARSAWATDQLDLSVALKTLPLLTNKISSPAVVAIIYDSANGESKVDAEAITRIIESGLEAPGNVKLTAQLISTNELSKISGAKIAFLAHGLSQANYNAIHDAASSANVLTICTDIQCVKTNKCILGVVSKPQVEVYYSPVAAEAANISFASAFTMLAKQVGSM